MQLPRCAFPVELQLSFVTPPDYARFLEAVRPLRRIWSLRRGEKWALLRDARELDVMPIWPSREESFQCARRWWPGLEPAPITISRFVDDWLNGRLAQATRVGVAIASPLEGILVDQYRIWIDLIETVDTLP